MPWGLKRYYGTGSLHFITWSCYHRQPLLDSAARRDLFLTVLEKMRSRYRFVGSFRSRGTGAGAVTDLMRMGKLGWFASVIGVGGKRRFEPGFLKDISREENPPLARTSRNGALDCFHPSTCTFSVFAARRRSSSSVANGRFRRKASSKYAAS